MKIEYILIALLLPAAFIYPFSKRIMGKRIILFSFLKAALFVSISATVIVTPLTGAPVLAVVALIYFIVSMALSLAIGAVYGVPIFMALYSINSLGYSICALIGAVPGLLLYLSLNSSFSFFSLASVAHGILVSLLSLGFVKKEIEEDSANKP